jgi:ribosome-associated toxin RatA of RatAB toxin-antitoxin module
MKTMPQVAKSVLVPYSAEAMFALVDAVERYPEFLPWCGGAKVHARDDVHTIATLDIRYAGVTQSFTTENTKTGTEQMSLKLRDGPFKDLRGAWRFHSLAAHGCKVSLDLEYAFQNTLLEHTIGPVFGVIADTMIDRFVARADALHAASLK